MGVSNQELRDWASELYEDEDLDEYCQKLLSERSFLYREDLVLVREVYTQCKASGRDGSAFNSFLKPLPNDRLETSELPPSSDPKYQYTFFHNACATHDFVWVDAMIRLGADFHRLSGNGDTALTYACGRWRRHPDERHSAKRTSGIRVIQRLLQVGVDPNIGYPLHNACTTNDMELCKILLANGADPTIRDDDGQLPKEYLAVPLRRRFTKLPRGKRPEPMCWCLTSGRLLKDCHDREGGREVDERFGCPCKSGKTYGMCCKTRGVKFCETRDEVHKVRHTTRSRIPATLPSFVRGPSSEEKKSLVSSLLATKQSSDFDPAFAYALENTDIIPKYWESLLPTSDRRLLRNEWNSAVDEYIASKRDTRSPREIEEGAKIGVDGARLYRDCSYCHKTEQETREFALCSVCGMRAYCGSLCQKRHWKEAHKTQCGKEYDVVAGESCPLHLPSQEAMLKAMKEKSTESAGSEIED